MLSCVLYWQEKFLVAVLGKMKKLKFCVERVFELEYYATAEFQTSWPSAGGVRIFPVLYTVTKRQNII